jgi:AcrR family transcriptional regulator
LGLALKIWHSVALCRARSYILVAMKKPIAAKTPSSQSAPRLRERKKDATRRALVAAAHRRFHKEGFEATTIDDICSDVGISRRTFFRYFTNKDALAFPNRNERLERFQELLEDAPRSERPLTSLRRIAQIFAREYAANRDQLISQQRLIAQTPSLIAREHDIDRDWENAMAEAFIQHLPKNKENTLRARMLAGAAIGVIRATMRYWFEMDGRVDLAKLGAEALDALQDGFLA